MVDGDVARAGIAESVGDIAGTVGLTEATEEAGFCIREYVHTAGEGSLCVLAAVGGAEDGW